MSDVDPEDLDRTVRTLLAALAISEWHFRDAVQDVLEAVNDYEEDL